MKQKKRLQLPLKNLTMALQSLLKRKKIMKTAVQYRILLKIGLISYSENNFQMTNYLQRILFFHCCHIIMLSFCEVKSKIMYNSFILFSSLSLIIDQACSTVFLTQLKFYHLPHLSAVFMQSIPTPKQSKFITA